MVELRRIDTLDRSNMTMKDSCRILQSRKQYLVKVEDNLHLVNDFTHLLVKKYADVSPDLVEVYVLNQL